MRKGKPERGVAQRVNHSRGGADDDQRVRRKHLGVEENSREEAAVELAAML